MSTKKHIRSFGKTFRYLKDPALRDKETGSATLVVEGAEFSGERFEGVDWSNIVFKNCDFVGAYEVKPQSSTRVRYEDCRFSGIFGYGKANDLHFLRCAWTSESNAYAAEGSRQVLFEACRFVGTNPDNNHWGAVGSDGEAEFVGCSAQMFNLDGHAKLTLRDCELQNVKCAPSARESGGVYAQVLIDKCKLRGTFDMVPASLQSLTIRDTQIETLDMNSASVKGDILMERVKGGYANVYVKEARSLTVRDSQFYGNGGKFFEAYAGGIRAIEIDNVTFGGDLTSEPVTITGGTGADLSTVRPRVNDSIIMRKSKVPRLTTHHVNTALYQLQDCEIGSLDLSSSRIGQLEIAGNTIARSVDFSNTQVKESKVQSFAGGQAKLDGSNIKLAR